MARPITKYLDDDGNEHADLYSAKVADRYIAARDIASKYVSTLDSLPKQQLTMKTNTLHWFINWLVDNGYVIKPNDDDVLVDDTHAPPPPPSYLALESKTNYGEGRPDYGDRRPNYGESNLDDSESTLVGVFDVA